jgi:uncharacterized protein (TIGR03905 family)
MLYVNSEPFRKDETDMKYVYQPRGVCSRLFEFDIEDGRIKQLDVVGGCNGNLKGISSLIQGLSVEDVIGKLKGLDCGGRGTSCPDQIAKALEGYLAQQA